MEDIFSLTPKKRFQIINRVSFINVISNFLIGFIKVAIAIVSGSIAVASDSVLNFGDGFSGIVTLIANKLSLKKPTKKHPYGFGRVEYLAIILAATIMMSVSIVFAIASIDHIKVPAEIHITTFQYILLLLIAVSKFVLYFYNKKESEKTMSGELEAVSHDSIIDAYGTTFTVALIFIDHFVSLELDGWIGLAVAIFIFVSSFIDILKTMSLMLGTKPDDYIVDEIRKTSESVKDVLNVRNIIIHSYGYNVHYGQMDVTLPSNLNTSQIVGILKRLDQKLQNTYNISFTFGITSEKEKNRTQTK